MQIRDYIRIIESYQILDALVSEAVGPFDPNAFIDTVNSVYQMSVHGQSDGERIAGKNALDRLYGRAKTEADLMQEPDRSKFLQRVATAAKGKVEQPEQDADEWSVVNLAKSGFQFAGVATRGRSCILFSGSASNVKIDTFSNIDDAVDAFKYKFQAFNKLNPDNAGWVYKFLPE